MKYILDTNILIHLPNGDPLPHDHLSSLNLSSLNLSSLNPGDSVRTTFVSVRELFWGAYNSKKAAQNLERIENLLEGINVLGCSLESSKAYGKLRADFSKKGIAFHDPDLVIASIALAEDATVVSNDQVFTRHPIKRLRVENWLEAH